MRGSPGACRASRARLPGSRDGLVIHREVADRARSHGATLFARASSSLKNARNHIIGILLGVSMAPGENDVRNPTICCRYSRGARV